MRRYRALQHKYSYNNNFCHLKVARPFYAENSFTIDFWDFLNMLGIGIKVYTWKNESKWPLHFLFILHQVKLLFQPSPSENTSNWPWNTSKKQDKKSNIDLYTYFLFWHSPHYSSDASMMIWWHVKLCLIKIYVLEIINWYAFFPIHAFCQMNEYDGYKNNDYSGYDGKMFR